MAPSRYHSAFEFMVFWRLLVFATASRGASIQLYFGNGCFFAHQYLLVKQFEESILGRENQNVTSIVGYAGSQHTGANGSACYHNSKNWSDYGVLGHAEVVEVDVPVDSLESAFKVYFDSFAELGEGKWTRPDYYDQGAEYRSLIGIPGGLANSKVVTAMREANVHNLTLESGHGSDPDTFAMNTVFVMDTSKFPFIQGELCLQFHDDSRAKYPQSYHGLARDLQANGRLKSTQCPGNYICNSPPQRNHGQHEMLV